jgi:hypothetical protein
MLYKVTLRNRARVQCVRARVRAFLWLPLAILMCLDQLAVILDVQYCSVHLRRGFCTIVLHYYGIVFRWMIVVGLFVWKRAVHGGGTCLVYYQNSHCQNSV